MLLRGPQTLAELHARSERLAPFSESDEVQQTLERLTQRSPALAIRLGRLGGQREARYMHLMCGPVGVERYEQAGAKTSAPRRGEIEARVAHPEQGREEKQRKDKRINQAP